MEYLREKIEEALPRILQSHAFARPRRLRALLAYLVDHALAGRDYLLNETSLAADLPGHKPIDLCRLSERLAEYYAYEGAADIVEIHMEENRLVPGFRERTAQAPFQGRLSLAILPFENRRGDLANDYLSEALPDGIHATLSQITDFRIAGRASAFSFNKDFVDVSDVGRQLRVSMVVRGTFQSDGDQFTVAVQLLSTENRALLWSHVYRTNLQELLVAEKRIVTDLVHTMTLLHKRKFVLNVSTLSINEDQKVHELIARGKYLFHQGNYRAWQESKTSFTSALEINPNSAEAWAGLAAVATALVTHLWIRPATGWREARIAVQKALEINPDQPEALTCAGIITALADFHPSEAASFFQGVLLRDTQNELARISYAAFSLVPTGRLDEAEDEVERVLEADPLNPRALQLLTAIVYFEGRWELALAIAQTALEVQPAGGLTHFLLGSIYDRLGKYDEALDAYSKWEQKTTIFRTVQWTTAMRYLYAGNLEAARGAASRAGWLARFASLSTAGMFADLFTRLGQEKHALYWLERAFHERSYRALLLCVDPAFLRLRGHPRFQALASHVRNVTESPADRFSKDFVSCPS